MAETSPTRSMPRGASSSANRGYRKPWNLGPPGRRPLRRCDREADDLLALQPGEQAGEFVLAHGLVAELQPEHAALGAVDDRGLVSVEQTGDVGDTGFRREPHQRARRRGAAGEIARDRRRRLLVQAERGGLERSGLVLHQNGADHPGLQQQRHGAEARRPGQRTGRQPCEEFRYPGGQADRKRWLAHGLSVRLMVSAYSSRMTAYCRASSGSPASASSTRRASRALKVPAAWNGNSISISLGS